MNKPDFDTLHPYVRQYSELGTGPVPVTPVVSPEYFERERETIFRKIWLNLGRVEDVPNPGDYVVRDIAILKASIIVVRGDDGQVRAFHNVCRHRGNQLVQGSGNARGFACGFHGWTYDTQGQCVFVPDEEVFFNLDRGQSGLAPVRCETFAGFVFVTVNPAAPPLAEYLGGFGQQIGDFPFHTMQRMHTLKADVNCNWKVFIDAFQESYHGRFVHRLTAAAAGCVEDDPYAHLTSVRLYGPHRSASVPFNPAYQPTPAEALSFKYAQSLWLHEGNSGAQRTPGTNPAGHPNWLFDINVCFPNFFVDVSNSWFFTYHFWPVAVDRTHWEYNFYMLPPANAGERISREYSKLYLRDLLREDLSTVESTQAGLNSGAIEHMILSDQEVAVRHQYKVVDDMVNGRWRG